MKEQLKGVFVGEGPLPHLPSGREGVVFRFLAEGDAGALFSSIRETWGDLAQAFPRMHLLCCVEDCAEFIMDEKRAFVMRAGFTLGIWVQGVFAGIVCVATEYHPDIVEISYWLVKRFRGRGLVRSVCAELLDYLFDEIGVHKAHIYCRKGDEKSNAVPNNLGFHPDACQFGDVYEPRLTWGILAQEWRDRRAEIRAHLSRAEVRRSLGEG